MLTHKILLAIQYLILHVSWSNLILYKILLFKIMFMASIYKVHKYILSCHNKNFIITSISSQTSRYASPRRRMTLPFTVLPYTLSRRVNCEYDIKRNILSFAFLALCLFIKRVRWKDLFKAKIAEG